MLEVRRKAIYVLNLHIVIYVNSSKDNVSLCELCILNTSL